MRKAITEDQATFFCEAHGFRNQAYHAGEPHDPIITELVTAYYSVACATLASLAPRMMHSRFDQNLSQRVAKHLKTDRGNPMPDVPAIAESLVRALPRPPRALAVACAECLGERLADIRDTIEYLVRNDGTAQDAEALVFGTQFWHAFWDAAPIEGLIVRVNDDGVAEVDPDQREEWDEAMRTMQATWSPGVSMSTLDTWESRIERLFQESRPGVLLQKYRKLQDEMEPFRKMISERCGRFDQHVEALVERRRESERASRGESKSP